MYKVLSLLKYHNINYSCCVNGVYVYHNGHQFFISKTYNNYNLTLFNSNYKKNSFAKCKIKHITRLFDIIINKTNCYKTVNHLSILDDVKNSFLIFLCKNDLVEYIINKKITYMPNRYLINTASYQKLKNRKDFKAIVLAYKKSLEVKEVIKYASFACNLLKQQQINI